MQYSTKRRVMLGMTTGGLLMTGLGMTSAHADTTATGNTSHSPGIGSGNLIQLPVNAPINVCGNQVDVIGILDSVVGNSCENGHGATGNAAGSTSASGTAKGSPGVGSGNVIQVPVNAPINVCGNQVDVIGIGNTDHGNSCANHGGGSTSSSGSSSHSPGIFAGNLIQVPVDVPINVCGNQVDGIGVLDSVTGNSCDNNEHGNKPPQPSPSPTPTPTPTPTSQGCGCTPPPPPPPTTPCPPSGTATPTPVGSSGSSSPSTKPSGVSSTGSHGGSNGSGSEGGTSASSGGSSGKPTGVLAHTGSGALAFAPLGAGLIGGGVLLRRRSPHRSH